MKLKIFIDRPILSCVVSVIILMLGVIGLSNLPMEQYPDIAPPTIFVSATYTGANAETVQKSVIAPLEEAINGVENMTYMTSTATNTGSASITVYFKQGTDPAAISAAGVRLRPILMTALTMIIGLFPLIIATGAGANGNRSLGVGAVGGMLVGTLALLFVVPVLFMVFQTIEERVLPKRDIDENL